MGNSNSNNAKRVARKAQATTGKLAAIDACIELMPLSESAERFRVIEGFKFLGGYEQGSILLHAKKLFELSKGKLREPNEWGSGRAGFQNWVLGELRIDLGYAGRQMRICKGVRRCGLEAEDVEGISSTSLLQLAPIMTSNENRVRNQLPELLELAQTSTVEAVKEAAAHVRGLDGDKKDADFHEEALASLETLGKKAKEKGCTFGYVLMGRDGKPSGDTFGLIKQPFLDAWAAVEDALKEVIGRTQKEKKTARAAESDVASAASGDPRPAPKKKAKRRTAKAAAAADMDQNEIDFDNLVPDDEEAA